MRLNYTGIDISFISLIILGKFINSPLNGPEDILHTIKLFSNQCLIYLFLE